MIRYELEQRLNSGARIAAERSLPDVLATDLTTAELRASRPVGVLAVWATFTSEAGNHYTVVHVPDHVDGPYILLSSEDRNADDFELVEALIARETNGIPDRIADRSDDICANITLNGRPTPRRIAHFIDGYTKLFRDVSIPSSYFFYEGDPNAIAQRARLPIAKVELPTPPSAA
jgi:hypothetical protein